MTLEEAIKHCEEVAEEAKRTPCIKGGLVEKCGQEHEQLAEWLKELKAYREAEEEIGQLPLSWEYGQAVTDVWNIFQKHLGKRGQDNATN